MKKVNIIEVADQKDKIIRRCDGALQKYREKSFQRKTILKDMFLFFNFKIIFRNIYLVAYLMLHIKKITNESKAPFYN